jgi:ribosomal protein S18 acetylase RimI-like enzyme
VIIAEDEDSGKLLGQLLIGFDFGDLGLIQPWQPIVHPDTDRKKVALALIEKSKEIIKSYGKSKIEIWMELVNDHVESISHSYRKWYEQCGYQLTSNEYNMETTYSELNKIPYSLPGYIQVYPMNSVATEDLHTVVFEVFKDSKDQWVNNMSKGEIKNIIRSWMKVEESFHPSSSIVFIEDGRIIGFNGMEIQSDSIEIGPLGVLPSHRGNQYGRKLILESIKRLKSDRREKIKLSVSTKNVPAINLYTALGFKTRYKTLIYTWIS